MIVTAFEICEDLGELHGTGLFQNGANLFFSHSPLFQQLSLRLNPTLGNGISYLIMEQPLLIYGRIATFSFVASQKSVSADTAGYQRQVNM